MIKVKDGYGKLIGTTYQGSATQVLLSNGGNLEFSSETKANTLVQRNASQHIYATYFNSAISDEALTDIGSVYVRNTSDTFIRRISKTQFYSIIDNKFVTLDTAQTITGVKTFSTGPILANNATITQNQNSTSNYTTVVKWLKGGTSQGTYNPSIGQHNTGGDGTGSICILPYPTSTDPWGGTVGLFISKGVLRLDGKAVAIAENYYTKTESDERYVNVTGDTMTGPLIVKASITGTQLISNIADGTAPLKVTSKTVVTNLNSDLLDGYHETSFFRARGSQTIASSIPTTTELSSNNNLSGNWNVSYPGASGHLIQFNTGSGSTRYMQFYSYYNGSLYWRNSTDSTLNTKSWKTIVDSANYTGIVLKIGTATKGSATLPIYLNAGTPTACSTTLGVSITGTAASARKLYKIDGTSRTWSTSESVVGNGIVAYTDTTTSGRWDSYGSLFQFSNADNPTPGTNGHWLTQLWSGTSNKLGVRWRTNTGGWTTMQTILTNTNYISYADTRYVTALGTSGNYLTWTKNGVVNNLTVPYSSYSGYLQSHDTRSTNNTPAQFSSGARFEFKYNSTDGLSNGGTYHGILHFKPYGGTTDFSRGQTHQLGFTDGGNLYMRTSTSSSAWGSWKLILTQTTADGRYVTSLGTNRNYLTWTKNGTTNNLTVPFATTSNVLNNLGNRTAISGTTLGESGLRLYRVHNNGYPVTYGNVLNVGGYGYGELLLQWTRDSSPGHLYYRSKRDVASQAWSNWVTILDNNNYSSTLDGRYVTLTTNQTVSGIKTFSTQQKFTVATGTSPFTVSSTTVVSNLNSDMLDGWHLSYILKDGYVTSGTSGLSSYWRKIWDITLNNQYNDVDINLLVHSAYNQQWGIISFRLRQNGTGTSKSITAYLAEVVGNIPLDRFRLYYNNSSGLCQLWCNTTGQRNVYNYRVLAKTWRIATESPTLGTFYSGNTTTAQALPSDSYVSMTGITIVNTASKVANALTFSAGKFSTKTYNGSAAVTVNIPTNTSHLTNDSGFWTGTRYWANIAVSTSSSSTTSPTFSNVYLRSHLYLNNIGSNSIYNGPNDATNGVGGALNNLVFSSWFGVSFTTSCSGQTYTNKNAVSINCRTGLLSANTLSGNRAYIGGYNNTSYALSTSSFICNSWVRSVGSTGWYNETYGGGWYMTDSTWIRTYGSKSVYQNTGQIRTDGYLVTNGGITVGATSPNNGTYKSHVTGNSWSSGYIRAGAGFYHNSVNSNSYVLLAGGSYKSLADFAKGNAGSATKGVYVTGGTVTAMTYSLSSNLNSGTSGKLAYYSSATTVAAYSSSVGSSAQPIYLNAGSLSASSYSFTGTYSNPVIVWCGEIYRSTPGSTYWYSVKKGGCCSISFTTNNAGSNGNLMISIPHCEPYAAFCSTVRIFDGSTAISAGDGTITGRSAGMGDYMTICGVSGTTGNVYIRKFSQQNSDNDTWKNGELGTTTTSKGNKPVARFYLMIVGRYI